MYHILLSYIHEAIFSLAIQSGLISQEKAMDGVMRSAGVSGIGGYRSLEIQGNIIYFVFGVSLLWGVGVGL